MKNSFLVLTSSLIFSSACWADASISITTDQQAVKILVKDQRVKVLSAATQDQVAGEAIYDQASDRLTIVDHANQSLFDLDAQTIKNIGGTLNAAVGVVQQQLSNLPSEQRSKMQDLMRGFGLAIPEESPPKLLLTAGSKRKYQGIECLEHQLTEGEKLVATVCVTQRNTLGISDQDYASLFAAQQFMLNAASQATQLAEQYGQKIPDFGGIELNGVLIHSLQLEPYDTDAEQHMNASFSVEEISTSRIEPIIAPSGYQQKNLPF